MKNEEIAALNTEEEKTTAGEKTCMGYPLDERPAKIKEGWAPGNYICECDRCDGRFIGDKRADCCADCAYKEEAFPEIEREVTGDDIGLLPPGTKVITEPYGEWPGGVGTIVAFEKDPAAPSIVAAVRNELPDPNDPGHGERWTIGIFDHEIVQVISDPYPKCPKCNKTGSYRYGGQIVVCSFCKGTGIKPP